jgi:PAS domain S-box-containing protein
MAGKIDLLLDELESLLSQEQGDLDRDTFVKLTQKLRAENEKLTFKFERASKEKNILSSLLTRTSNDLMEVSNKLKIRAEELSTLLQTIPTFIYFKDIRLSYILVNRAFEELVGLPSSEIIGKKLHDIFPGYNSESYTTHELEVLKTGVAVYDIEETFTKNGNQYWEKTNIAPIRNSENTIIGLIGISWDITDWKLHEVELTKAKELAEAGTQAKNEFIASVSHELRTPMNGILGLSEILKNTTLSTQQFDLLKGITTSAENLLILLNDVLDFSAIEAGKMEVDVKPFNLQKVLDDISLITKLKANEKSLDFQVETEPDLPVHLYGDAQRLRQIILNLTNNAVKFTEKGKISLSVKVEESAGKTALLRFDVADTGMGIPKSAIGSLFQVFSRVKSEKSTLIAGTGLGLSICKKLTDLMGGRIGVKSTIGKGSLFYFILPFLINEDVDLAEKTIPNVTDLSFHKKKVLVAEDNLINQRIIEFQLKKMGLEVDLVTNGQEAIGSYCKKEYDLIILDIQMPVMDGYQAAQKIRELEKSSALHTPIIALTANAMKGDRELYLSAGMDDYISKPFTFEVLSQTIEQVIDKPGQE